MTVLGGPPCFSIGSLNELLEFGKGLSGIIQCYTVGGFNVSNLMGIKWRMIDIGKKITFYLLQNV